MFKDMFNAEGDDRFVENTAFIFTFHSDANEDINYKKNQKQNHYIEGVQKMLKDQNIFVS